jgi:cell wall assembly regulator SMI1
MPDMKTTWQAIKGELSRIAPHKAASLNRPAMEQELQDVETKLDCILPDDFKDYLRIFNGQKEVDYLNPLFAYQSFLSTSNLLTHWQMLMDNWSNEPPIAHIKENKVKSMFWTAKWIPFAENEGGSSQLCIDLNPGKNGIYGQVLQLHFGQDLEADEVVIANSFSEFSQELLKRLQTGNFMIEDDYINFEDYWIV